ncbi:ChaC-like protein [Coniophora puteana RWD-64-598 SS2]|uniref:glutathione-specific gamma-glutamylcyclotransferase n=1 Tax=Coniophora puteana (strain RWD-64-598) TaxID=741705 RepID=A0A5M3MG63_CONPW|nr:ChaC-like protein [Coniophora puteana RWD-64-598 SS2]EIW77986.1 ChaC-like protein [Coniophora puteana RWD-64-598 SS2]
MTIPQIPPFTVFGYGSLIFKVRYENGLVNHSPGFIKGYVRRFSQMSHHHRGTPENPGRAVTLIHKEDWDHYSASDPYPDDDTVWGIAYTIDPVHEKEARAYLDHRERASHSMILLVSSNWQHKNGYTLETMDIYDIVDGEARIVIHNCHCYVGRPDNPAFTGSEPLDKLSHHIWQSIGPSGRNKDYLYQLAEAVHKLSPASRDAHLFALEARVRELDSKLGDT